MKKNSVHMNFFAVKMVKKKKKLPINKVWSLIQTSGGIKKKAVSRYSH